MWDAGRDFFFSGRTTIDTVDPYGAEWAQRLESEPRTVAFDSLDPGDDETLIDPETGSPAVRRSNGKIVTAIPQRLPTTSPLSELILAQIAWVRTRDGMLYPAPVHPHGGNTWGYEGTGPRLLALLTQRLLDDITAPAPGGAREERVARGLARLTVQSWPRGTVFTRERLLEARDGPAAPG